MSKHRWLLIIVLGLAWAVTGCSGGEVEATDDAATEAEKAESGDSDGTEGTDGEEEEETKIPVEVVALSRGPIEAVLHFTADLEAEHAVPVVGRTARRVLRLHVEEGDQVRRGQLVATLEDEQQRNAVARIEGQLARARREHDRQQNLYDRQLISEQSFNDARYELDQQEIALAEAMRELSYTEVRTPIAGTVTERLLDVGDEVTMGQPLFQVVDFDSLVVRAFVPERQLPQVALGQPVRLMSQALPQPVAGQVERIAPIVDPRTGTVKVTIEVPYVAGLRPGMFLEGELVTAVRETALLVPKRALVLDDDQAFVFRLVGDSEVERLEVRPWLEDSLAVEVEEGVLSDGDRIVIAGQAGLKAGDQVRIVGGTDPDA